MSNKKIKVLNPSLMSDSTSLDNLRNALGGSWQTGINGGYRYIKAHDQDADLVSLSEVVKTNPNPTRDPAMHTQTIIIKQSTDIDSSPGGDSDAGDQAWEAYVNGLAPYLGASGRHTDTYALFYSTVTTEEALNIEAEFPEMDAGVDYVYNFLDTAYENILENTKKHTVIPNLYAMTMDSLEVDTEAPALRRASLVRRIINNRRASMGAVDARLQYTNQIVPAENLIGVKYYEGNKYLFPMYSQINIPLHKNNEISQAVGDSKLGCLITRDLHGVGVDLPDTIGYEDMLYSFVYYNAIGERIIEPLSVPAQTVDLLRWLNEDAAAWGFETPMPPDWTYLGPRVDGDSAMLADTENQSGVAFGIDYLRASLFDIADEKMRTYQDLLDGTDAYSETLMFKVTKFLGEGIDNEVQTFHLMNTSELDDFIAKEKEVALIDTQVKYGQTYTYSVVAYEAVIGTSYKYTNVEVFNQSSILFDIPSNTRWARMDVEMVPLIKLIEVPLFMSTGKIIDNPPLSPEISFRPFRNLPNNLMFFLNTNTGVSEEEPIALTSNEAIDASQIMFNQKRTDGKISFMTDDYNVAYQVYRVNTPPLSYGDFTNKLLAVVSTADKTSRNGLTASSAAIMLSQSPNRKFYYMFRAVDYHGGLSNPSPVYEIELYNDGGVGYPLIKEYEFDSVDPKTTTKSARKLIQIVPRITQAYLNEVASGLTTADGDVNSASGNRSIVLGVEDDPLFGKKFKIRLTSKTTGKKLDINVDFKTKRVRGAIE
jgi:hypothetical protein